MFGKCVFATLVQRSPMRFVSALALAAALMVPGGASAQSMTQQMQQKIEALEKQIEALKTQMKSISEEQKTQKEVVRQTRVDVKKSLDLLPKVEISGAATGMLQGTSGVDKEAGGNEGFSVGLFDLAFTHEPAKNLTLQLVLEGIAGDGPDARFGTFSGLNSNAGDTGDELTVLEATLEATFGALTLTAGKIDLTNYIDGNNVAGDSASQFVTGAFSNNAVLSAPDNAAGARARLDLPKGFYVESGFMDQDADGSGSTNDKLFDHIFSMVEVGYGGKAFGREGNYRLWGFADGNGLEMKGDEQERYTAYGYGVSIDQELTPGLSMFLRLGFRDSDNLSYDTESAWSAGFQMGIPGRPSDAAGLAFGAIKPIAKGNAKKKDEETFEAYYRWHFAENVHLSPILQFVKNPEGNPEADDLVVLGARFQVDF